MTPEQVIASWTDAEQARFRLMDPVEQDSLLRQAVLWYKLREDPEFQEHWLRSMGNAAPVPPEVHRTWGDGATSQREHWHEDLSFGEGWVQCGCTVIVHSTDRLSLEDAWDIHRGKRQLVEDRQLQASEPRDLADDDEVHSFLTRVSDPGYAYEVPE